MRSVAYALPVKDREAGLKFVEELAGERADKFHESRTNQGFQRVKVFLQDEPQEMVVIYIEGSSNQVHDHINTRTSSPDPMETWFEDQVEKVTGHRLSNLTANKLPSQLLFDWHPQHGVSRSHHSA